MNSVAISGTVSGAVEPRLFAGLVLKDVFLLEAKGCRIHVSKARQPSAPPLSVGSGDKVYVRGKLAVVSWQGTDATGPTRPEILADVVERAR